MSWFRTTLITYCLFSGILFQCKPPELSNACDAKTDAFLLGSIIRYVTGDRSPSCLPSFDFQDLWGVFRGTSGFQSANAITSYNEQIIIGGNFQYLGPSTGNVVYLESANGNILPNRYCPYLKVSGATYTAISDGSGGFYIGGAFYSVQGEDRSSIAHILPGCQLDRNFKTPIDDTREVRAFLLRGDSMYVGGNFTNWDGNTNYRHLIRLNRYTGALEPDFNLQVDDAVFDLESDLDAMYICGSFGNISGLSRRNLAKYHFASGSVLSSFNPGVDGGFCLDIHYGTDVAGSPNIYAVGDSLSISPRVNAFSVYPDGTVTVWTPNVNSNVRSVQQYGNTIYLGGQFTTVNGATPATNLVSVNNNTGTAIATNYAVNGEVASLQIIENTLYISGSFTSIKSVPRNYVAALDLPSEEVNAFDPKYDNTISNPGSRFVPAGNGVVLVTSDRSTVNVTARSNFAVIDEYTGKPIEGTPYFDMPIKSLLRIDNSLFVGGSFTNVQGQSKNAFVVLDLPHYTINARSPTVAGGTMEVRSITNDETQIYAVGNAITTVNGASRNNAFSFNISDLSLTNWNPNLNGAGNSVLSVNDLVFIGGAFLGINGDGTTFRYQAVDKSSGTKRQVPSGSVFPNAAVNTQTLVGDKIFLGGEFISIGTGYSYLAIYNLTTQSFESPSLLSADNIVKYIASYPDGNVFIGGDFTVLNGSANDNKFGVYNANLNAFSPWNAGMNDAVLSSHFKNGKYYLGGLFQNAFKRNFGGLVRSSLNE
ncbi:hypothetical protein LEP1GSC202_2735 [Leptospira yanagawae serovar Saopaulo str. Sao Paulo = ATCC 700523]|uniref:Uncharacterized protein n=1 Tax=Leptospira yanagawae serovar Saopaulo str. Sao Paulo = ATCC 700523 TaxID=1249483 RepID=A0A5E8HBQ5_9LEPT|nr:hypothetical protein [Leptospira yanagawae]EOQ88725.1 hypothetical protein LEP1GSC202_2735 [Leptospira yanagawae serovar Saopaulo str. Sao Paulo = ATCC 700523]